VSDDWNDQNQCAPRCGQDLLGLLKGNVARRIAEVTDGTSNTIMYLKTPVVLISSWRKHVRTAADCRVSRRNTTNAEDEGSGAGWADYNSDSTPTAMEVTSTRTGSSNNEVYSFHSGGANHLFADGSVHL